MVQKTRAGGLHWGRELEYDEEKKKNGTLKPVLEMGHN